MRLFYFDISIIDYVLVNNSLREFQTTQKRDLNPHFKLHGTHICKPLASYFSHSFEL
jgi:hypothetical protein